ncbi:MAG: hypothetical protein KKD44_26550, partial [Proteobacteria bacterium]|nr:hypothetical protein [Pseudomonadota bacterium]
AVLVSYDYGQNLNLVSEDRMWHPKIGDLEGDSNGDVTHIAYLDEDTGDFAADWTLDGAAVTTNEHTKYLVDGRADTGWGLVFSNDPTGGNVIGLVCWFNDALDTMDVEEIEVTLDARMTSYAPGYGVKVNGFTGITLGDPPTLSGTKEISSALVLRFEEGNTATQSKITISAKDIGDPLKGIYIWWDRLSRKGSDEYALVKEVKVIGKKKATVLVQLTDSSYPDTDGGALHLSQFMYAPESYQKLVDNGYFAWIPERHRVKAINIGPGTFNTAVSLGRLVLLQSLVLEQQRNYSMTGKFKHIPPLGSTVLMQDGFQGVVLGVAYASDGGPETLTIRVLDFESGLVS